jgi:hypothetical protein
MEEKSLLAVGAMATLGLGLSVVDYLQTSPRKDNHHIEKVNRASPDPELQVNRASPMSVIAEPGHRMNCTLE